MNQSLKLSIVLMLNLSPLSAVNGDVLLESSDNTIWVPYLNYQGNNYQAEFSILDSNRLRLNSAISRTGQPVYGTAIPVDDALNFTLQRINFDGLLYNAQITRQQQDLFNYDNVSSVDETVSARGEIIQSLLVNELSQAQFDLLVSAYNFQTGSNYAFAAKNAIQVYAVTYRTLDPAGSLTEASALIAFPVGSRQSYPLLAFQHGTEVLRSAAPSRNAYDIATLALAASGYVVVSADYIGLGESVFLHPFIHAHSLATAVIDALRATRLLTAENNINLNGQLFLAGYSEGGYATMVVHRELQNNYADEFSVTASAPMAGSYDLSGTMRERFLDDTPHPNPYYFPYTILAYNQVYGLSDDLNDFFQPPYDQTISELFDGNHTSSQINASLPERRQLFTQALYDDLAEQQNSWLKTALSENDSYRWKPESPMFLFHCLNDEQVPYQNSQVAYDYFQSVGATQVQLFTIDDADLNQGAVHDQCAVPLMLNGLSYFEAMRL